MSLMMSQPPLDFNSPILPSVTFDPPAVRPGQSAYYRVTLNALEQSIDWPATIPSKPALEFRPGARGQVLQYTGGGMAPLTGLNFRVTPTAAGQVEVPEFIIKVYDKTVTVPAARLSVAEDAPPPEFNAVPLTLELTPTNPFVGQSVEARLLSPSADGGFLAGLNQVQLNGDGILVDQSSVRQRIERMPRGGVNVPVFIYETSLTPIQSGAITIYGQGFTANRGSAVIIVNGSVVRQGGPAQMTLLESEVVQIHARPLPTGQLAGFTGAVGSYQLDLPALSTNAVRVGEPVKLFVTVRSGGNIARLVAPPAPTTSDWQIFAPTPGAQPDRSQSVPGRPIPAMRAGDMQSAVMFEYTLVPLTEKLQATPAIPFSYFDPARGAYVDLTIAPVKLTVNPSGAPTDLAVLRQTGANGRDEEIVALSGLAKGPGRSAGSLIPLQQQAWFPFLQLAPAALFGALWLWDCRRRHLELHPEILRRRYARRALRREWRTARQAARSGDAPKFTTAAVNAMRAGCAPHYPAEPRALVGGDVIQLLAAGEHARPEREGEIVRRFFASADAAEFNGEKEDGRELLGLRPELDSVLEHLEQRL
jgi:hypothetical protein